jgi:hypothetical protein
MRMASFARVDHDTLLLLPPEMRGSSKAGLSANRPGTQGSPLGDQCRQVALNQLSEPSSLSLPSLITGRLFFSPRGEVLVRQLPDRYGPRIL